MNNNFFEKNFNIENGVALIAYSYKNLYSLGFSTSQTEDVLLDEKDQNDGSKNKIAFVGDLGFMT